MQQSPATPKECAKNATKIMRAHYMGGGDNVNRKRGNHALSPTPTSARNCDSEMISSAAPFA